MPEIRPTHALTAEQIERGLRALGVPADRARKVAQASTPPATTPPAAPGQSPAGTGRAAPPRPERPSAGIPTPSEALQGRGGPARVPTPPKPTYLKPGRTTRAQRAALNTLARGQRYGTGRVETQTLAVTWEGVASDNLRAGIMGAKARAKRARYVAAFRCAVEQMNAAPVRTCCSSFLMLTAKVFAPDAIQRDHGNLRKLLTDALEESGIVRNDNDLAVECWIRCPTDTDAPRVELTLSIIPARFRVGRDVRACVLPVLSLPRTPL